MAVATRLGEKNVQEEVAKETQPQRITPRGTNHTELPEDNVSVSTQLPPPPDGGLHAWLKVFVTDRDDTRSSRY